MLFFALLGIAVSSSTVPSVLIGSSSITQGGDTSLTVVGGSPIGSDSKRDGISKDIVSNVFKAIQITTQENLFLANLFTAASKISTLSLEATSVAINVRVLEAYVDLVTKSLELLGKHQDAGIGYGKLIQAVLDDTTRVMQGSLP